jgi:hypothetical protein
MAKAQQHGDATADSDPGADDETGDREETECDARRAVRHRQAEDVPDDDRQSQVAAR